MRINIFNIILIIFTICGCVSNNIQVESSSETVLKGYLANKIDTKLTSYIEDVISK
ncbi:MAG: hypothetical protein GY714_24730, partial [Desulfobacterales bacterium]|nr:hypothetical protein [Desulfobacterales bacterium]